MDGTPANETPEAATRRRLFTLGESLASNYAGVKVTGELFAAPVGEEDPLPVVFPTLWRAADVDGNISWAQDDFTLSYDAEGSVWVLTDGTSAWESSNFSVDPFVGFSNEPTWEAQGDETGDATLVVTRVPTPGVAGHVRIEDSLISICIGLGGDELPYWYTMSLNQLQLAMTSEWDQQIADMQDRIYALENPE